MVRLVSGSAAEDAAFTASFSATTSDGIVAMGEYLSLPEADVQLYSAQVRGRLSLVLGA